MATIRVRDWTKKQIERISEAESHSSHDSVIKSLLKDRELAQVTTQRAEPGEQTTSVAYQPPDDKQFVDLTVLTELGMPDNGVLFLWCPNCASELAHLTVDGPMRLSVFEMECQQCLQHLDQHAIVAIEIGYPIEQKISAETLQTELKACVVDYWDRSLERFTETTRDEEADIEDLVWQFGQYLREFDWEWPADRPVVSFEAETSYRNTMTGERIEVVEPVTDNRNAIDSFEVRRYPSDAGPGDADLEIMDSSTVVDLIASRSLERQAAGEDTGGE